MENHRSVFFIYHFVFLFSGMKDKKWDDESMSLSVFVFSPATKTTAPITRALDAKKSKRKFLAPPFRINAENNPREEEEEEDGKRHQFVGVARSRDVSPGSCFS